MFSSGPFWTHKIKTKAKYISISNILHLLSAPASIPAVLACLVVESKSNCKFFIVSNFCLIVDWCFHPSRVLTMSFKSFTPLTWMYFCYHLSHHCHHFFFFRYFNGLSDCHKRCFQFSRHSSCGVQVRFCDQVHTLFPLSLHLHRAVAHQPSDCNPCILLCYFFLFQCIHGGNILFQQCFILWYT